MSNKIWQEKWDRLQKETTFEKGDKVWDTFEYPNRPVIVVDRMDLNGEYPVKAPNGHIYKMSYSFLSKKQKS